MLASLLATQGRAQIIIEAPQPIAIGEPDVVTTVTLRPTVMEYRPASVLSPVWVQAGSTVRVQLGADVGSATVEWYHNAQKVGTGPTFELRKISEADEGGYGVAVKDGSQPPKTFEPVTLRVGEPQLRKILNLSARGRISASQPEFIAGFVLNDRRPHELAGAMVLVRAVGPGLVRYGVTDPLAEPQLRVFRADGTLAGTELTIAILTGPDGTTSESLPSFMQRVGAFPLPENSKDVVKIFSLPPGAYTAVVSSANGGSGTVLVEVYDVPP